MTMTVTSPCCFLSNGHLDVDVALPDSETGFYRGSRFDWSGIIRSLRYRGHEYFGPWKDDHDPYHHDCITGPAEEFETTAGGDFDFDSVPEGTAFLRLGVGLLRKLGTRFHKFTTYPILDASGWKTTYGEREVTFSQSICGSSGAACFYQKDLVLSPDSPTLRLQHLLINCGDRIISTRQYNHNFFQIDGVPPGPSLHLRIPQLRVAEVGANSVIRIDRRKVFLQRPLQPNERILQEFSIEETYDIDLFQSTTGAGVRIRSESPITRFILWASDRVFCPEPYVDIDVSPGSSMSWTVSYDFYTAA